MTMIKCVVCGRIIEKLGSAHKYCDICAPIISRKQCLESMKRRDISRKQMWESLTPEEKTDALQLASDYFLNKE